MPELPEVEAARSLLQQWCIGKRVLKAVVENDTMVIDGIQHKELQIALEGRIMSEACRKGKQLWINFDEGPSLLLHLGMTGHVAVKGQESLKYMLAKAVDINEWPPKYCKLQVVLSGNISMAFCDSRRFAKVKFLEGSAMEDSLPSGWDALNDEPTVDELAARVGKKRVAVKSVLLDQAVYAGIGNWCADDILLEARIHPQQLTCDLTADQLESLRSGTRSIMSIAVGCGADSNMYPKHWLFHSRWAPKKAPPHVSFLTIGGRTTALDEVRQRLNGPSNGSRRDTSPANHKSAESAHTAPAKPLSKKRAAPAGRKASKGEADQSTTTATDDKRCNGSDQTTLKETSAPAARSAKAKPSKPKSKPNSKCSITKA